jgi:hypothetical protein
MEVEELLRRAKEAVEAAGIPEALQETAFKEAIAILRSPDGEQTAAAKPDAAARSDTAKRGGAKRTTPKRSAAKAAAPKAGAKPIDLDEKEFFDRLAKESGVPQADLRDVLHLSATDGQVQVIPATKDLGSNLSEQAKTVTVLVAGARSIGERPVDAAAVRAEVRRKNCYDAPNYSGKHLGRLKGFKAGSRGEILLTSKWVDEFVAAANKALGRKPEPGS